MSDNLFQQVGEALEDASTVHSFFQDDVPRGCKEILMKAYEALTNGDQEEAEHQLRRELYLAEHYIPGNNEYAYIAQAALQGLKHGYVTDLVEDLLGDFALSDY